MPESPSHNHYAPQFYLRLFASDEKLTKIPTVTKHETRAVWAHSSIEYVGAEEDLYTVAIEGVPASVESKINRQIESPISRSDTWTKIAADEARLLTEEDKPVIYAMMRHLELRTPHARRTMEELIEMCAERPQDFSADERQMYAELRRSPELRGLLFAHQASSTEWTWEQYGRAHIAICRTRIPLKTSSVPVHVIKAPEHPGHYLPLPGQVPYSSTMTLNRHAFVTLTLGDFGGKMFANEEVPDDVGHGYNRHRVAQFAHFEANRHLIADRIGLAEDMTWAGYEVELDRPNKITFKRRT
jgi:hypothetical protein